MQHSIAKQGEHLWKLLSEDGAYIYVCGCGCMQLGQTHSELTRHHHHREGWCQCSCSPPRAVDHSHARRGTKMGADVKTAFKQLCQQYGGGSLVRACCYAGKALVGASERVHQKHHASSAREGACTANSLFVKQICKMVATYSRNMYRTARQDSLKIRPKVSSRTWKAKTDTCKSCGVSDVKTPPT